MSTSNSLLEAVNNIAPIIEEYSKTAEKNRGLSEFVAIAMRDAGLFRLFRPKAFGGWEVDPVEAFRVIEEVSRIDSAAGWNLQISTAFDLFGPWFGDKAAKEIFTSDAILAGAFNPPRRAVPVSEGYRVSGKTSFVSGAHQATSFLGLINIFNEDEIRLGANGLPEALLTAYSANDVKIIDNWDTLGMRGTGSHDVIVDNAFVPQHKTTCWTPLNKPGTAYKGPLYRLTIWPAVAVMAATALGIARAAVEETIELALKKSPAYTTKTLKDRGVVQSHLARAQALVDGGRSYLHQVFEESWQDAVTGKPITINLKARMQLASTHCVLQSANAVDLIHEIVGASGVREEYRFARRFRDIHTLTQHGFINAGKLESVGQIMLGLDPEWPFFSF